MNSAKGSNPTLLQGGKTQDAQDCIFKLEGFIVSSRTAICSCNGASFLPTPEEEEHFLSRN